MQQLPDNYYQVLSLPDFSSLLEIKKSYRKLALKFHPDRNKAHGAKERFQVINNAYSFLTAKKDIYDRLLKEQKYSLRSRVQTFHYNFNFGSGASAWSTTTATTGW